MKPDLTATAVIGVLLVSSLATSSAIPSDPAGVEIIEDLAHHLGNWIGEVPPWYDWDRHLLRSTVLGTHVVRTDAPHDLNVPDCMRFILIALVLVLEGWSHLLRRRFVA